MTPIPNCAPANAAAPAAKITPALPSARPLYLQYLTPVEPITLDCGDRCGVWELNVPLDQACLSDWATRFRQTYCLDSDLDVLRYGTGKSRAEYLIDLVFPDKSTAPGPAVRSGDFAELLITDYVEHLLGYWVPRSKYAEKGSRDESVKGVDIIGFRCKSPERPEPIDEMLMFEVKAQLSGGKYADKLQVAVKDSGKDHLRSGETLAAMKRRMHMAEQKDAMQVVQRFQSPVDRPYVLLSGAATVLSDDAFEPAALKSTSTTDHNNSKRLSLIAVKGKDLMALAHALYQRAADEA